MHRKLPLVVAFWTCLLLVCSCGTQPEPTAETKSAFTCAQYNSFTHLCELWVPDAIPYASPNYVPYGQPFFCPTIEQNDTPGWVEIYSSRPFTEPHSCLMVPPGDYANLGNWDFAGTTGVAPVHIRAMETGPQANLWTWDQPNYSGNLIGYYPPGSVVMFTSTVQSFEIEQF